MPTDQLVQQIQHFIAEHAMLPPHSHVLVGVSGGADSLCLLHVLLALQAQLKISVHVAHLDHQLRGDDSARDAAAVADIANAWGVPYTTNQIDVNTLAKAQRLNLHDAARRLRYRFFAQLASQLNIDSVAVAHTANDQAETVLMHLLRGSGTTGLAGIRPVASMPESPSHRLIRPLLATTRVDIETYCTNHGIVPQEDRTNADTIYTRNRIRHELLPLLMTYNPHIVTALGTTAAISADDTVFIQHALDAVWPELAMQQQQAIRFDGAIWATLAPTLQRSALRRAYTLLGGSQTLAWAQIEQGRMLAGRVDQRLPLPGAIWLSGSYGGGLLIGQEDQHGPQIATNEAELPIPGRLELADGWSIETSIKPFALADRWQIAIDRHALKLPLIVRGRRSGDRIQLEQGRKSLQNLFVDAKVPQAMRAGWPILIDQQQIIWVAGLRAAAHTRALPDSSEILWIQIIPPNVQAK